MNDEIRALNAQLLSEIKDCDLKYPTQEYPWFINFDLGYAPSQSALFEPVLQSVHDDIYKTFKPKHQKRTKLLFDNTIRLIILNLINISRHNDPYLKINLDRNVYHDLYTPKNTSYRMFREAYDNLVELGYVELHKKGSYHKDNPDLNSVTSIKGTEKLYGLIAATTDMRELKFISTGDSDQELIILKKTVSKKGAVKKQERVEYKDTPYTKKARSNLKKINKVIQKASVQHVMNTEQHEECKLELQQKHRNYNAAPIIDYSKTRLCRIYNNGFFEHGGRFYWGWWQNIPKEYRKYIQINNNPTVELDYSRLHPTMLYAKEGISLDFDPYEVPSLKHIIHNHRDVGKTAFNALINAARSPKSVPSDFLTFRINTDKELVESHNIKWEEFLDIMIAQHEPIAHYFKTGIGIELMNMDAAMAEIVLLHFAKQGIPCLPVHDSFIVDENYEGELEDTMHSAYEEVMKKTVGNGIYEIGIKKK